MFINWKLIGQTNSLQARIKKIMQLDDDVGRVASAVPVVICILIS